MEKPLLIQGLRTRIGEDDAKVISDKTFDGVATEVLALFEDDSKITDDTWKLPVALLKQFAGQKRYDDKQFTEKFKSEYAKEYEAQHSKDIEARIQAATAKALEDYKKEHPEVQPQHKGEEQTKDLDTKIAEAVSKAMEGLTGTEGVIGKLTKTITDFTNVQQEREKNAKLAAVKEQLRQHLVGLKANNTACIEDALSDLEYGDDPKFDDLKQKCIDAFEKRYKRYYGDGSQPFGGNGTGDSIKDKNKSYVKSYVDRLKKEAEEQQAYQETLEQRFQ